MNNSKKNLKRSTKRQLDPADFMGEILAQERNRFTGNSLMGGYTIGGMRDLVVEDFDSIDENDFGSEFDIEDSGGFEDELDNEELDSYEYNGGLDEVITEYNDSYASPEHDKIVGREEYSPRDFRDLRDLLGRRDDELIELVSHVVNGSEVSVDNALVNRPLPPELADHYSRVNLRGAVNRMIDYGDVLEGYVQNLKYGLLELPEELWRERALLIFSFQDLLETFLNMSCEKDYYFEILTRSGCDTIRKLADGEITIEEAKEIARENEILLEGFGRLNDDSEVNKYFDAVMELEDAGYPCHDVRVFDEGDEGSELGEESGSY